ncbi:MAG: aldehyde dehydrogenase family protein [Limisphaerales bacterium]
MRVPIVQFETEQKAEPLLIVQRGKVVSTADWIREARFAQKAWATIPIFERLKWVRRVRELIAGKAKRLASLEAEAACRPLAEVLSAQVLPLCDACRFLEREAEKLLRPRKLGRAGRPIWLTGVEAEVHREPYGLILVIAPSNYRLFLPGVMVMQALAAGNAVFFKPGPGGTKVGEALLKIFEEAGLDPRLCRLLPELPEATRDAIASGVDKIVFTGSAETGQQILLQAASRLTPTTMELSGCDALFVRDDADLPLAARAVIFGLTLNNSETCIAPRRVFVSRARASAFQETLVELISRTSQHSSRNDEVFSLVQEAINNGAELIAGGLGKDGVLHFPVVLSHVPAATPLLRSDVFAPVVSIVEVKDDEEAIAQAADCPFALGASIFTQDHAAAAAMTARLCAGSVIINDLIAPTADPRLPFGGRRRSGFGVTRGREGLLEMTVPKVISHRKNHFHVHLEAPTEIDAELMERLISATHGKGLFKRLTAWMRLGKLLKNRRKL